MLYRNIKTGAEFESKSKLSAPDWMAVGAEVPSKEITPHKMTPEAEVQEMPPQEEKKTETKAPASKKTTKRTRK